ncbi:hypothetical protein PR003_g3344 [Phytophthora rubi]|uniref:Uncharacterized protein n=1 Tax=Phytophthora rubi TaxID=129364 RepID=A0A6A4FQB7_9STRA|nr:hypothetical protein PR001_g3433 [Phytophthora rubi]KAE9354451.1 hypothetical protein PR003_g3344 [Phytophthora rubi]
MDQLLDAVNDASTSSALVHIPKKNNIFKEYRKVVDDAYKKLKDIQKFQIFSMQEDKPGVVTCKKGPDAAGVSQDLRRKYDGIVTDGTRVRVLFETDLAALPNPPPNSEKIQTIYNKVRRYVPEEFRDDPLYDPPNDEDERKAKEIQKPGSERQQRLRMRRTGSLELPTVKPSLLTTVPLKIKTLTSMKPLRGRLQHELRSVRAKKHRDPPSWKGS